MYIWVGINVEEQLKDARMAVDRVFDKIDISNVTCQLPLHISLKISFEIENSLFDSVLNDIIAIYKLQQPFEIKIKGIEIYQNIEWIRMYSNENLEALSTELNIMLRDKYGVPLHEYDLDFVFHTTLFMDDDAEKINAAHNLLGDLKLPQTLTANTFVIGKSKTGENGTYRVYNVSEFWGVGQAEKGKLRIKAYVK